ncbi:MAG TPA: helix-turn-helix transcriptional regulator [Azospirillum sp.]|nr:helix-turn-helix transcriptional regulator [Azospirillum sp.]
MDVLKAFGAALRQARADRGLTQEEVAHRAGIAIGYLSQLENGRRNPSLLLIAALCGALDIQISDVIKDVVIERRSAKS